MKLRNPFRRIPKLTGWPQIVEFRDVPMRIVSVESRFGDGPGNVTLRLVDEASYQESRTR